MLNIPDSLKAILKQDYLPYRVPVEKQLVLYKADLNLTITDDDFTDGDSFSLEDNLCGDELTFGDCGSACLKFKVEEIDNDLVGKKFTAKYIMEGTDIELGTFIVTEAKKEDNDTTKSIVAYDLMYLFNKDVLAWYDGLTYPMSLKAFRNSLCTYCEVEYVDSNLPNDTMNVEKTISTNILNGREVLNKCEELNGCFGHMNRDGKLDHIVLSKSNPVETITDVSYDTLKFEEYTTDIIDKVQIRTEDGDIGAYVGTGTNCYSITANYLVYGKTAAALSTICTNLSTNILGVTYRPYESDMQGLPYLNIGDYVKFEGNETANTYIMQRTLSGTQILADKVSAKGSKTLSEDNNINVQIEQMKGKTNVLTRDVEKMESTISEFDKQINVLLPGPWYPDGSILPCQNNMTNLEYEINSKILQTAKEITTEVNNVSEQLNTKITQTATSITAEVNNLAANTSAQFAITDSEISTKVEKNGVISAINQTAESITISANKINFNGVISANGNFKVTTSGDLEATSAKLINAYFTNGIYYEYSGLRFPIFEVPSQGILQIANSATHCKFMGSIEARNAVFTNLLVNGSSVLTSSTYATDLRVSLSTSPTYPGTYYLSFNNTSGDENVPTMGWVKARQASDERLKEDFSSMNIEKRYLNIQPLQYKFKKGVNNNYIHFGFKAQGLANEFDPNMYDLVEYDTEIVTKGEKAYVNDGVYRINYDNMHAMHVMMIQKLYKKISDLEEVICI